MPFIRDHFEESSYELLRKVDAELKYEVWCWASYYVSALSISCFIEVAGIGMVMSYFQSGSQFLIPITEPRT